MLSTVITVKAALCNHILCYHSVNVITFLESQITPIKVPIEKAGKCNHNFGELLN
jgi:hypothetical protein